MQPSPTRDLLLGLFVAAGLLAIGYMSLQLGGVRHARTLGSPVSILVRNVDHVTAVHIACCRSGNRHRLCAVND